MLCLQFTQKLSGLFLHTLASVQCCEAVLQCCAVARNSTVEEMVCV